MSRQQDVIGNEPVSLMYQRHSNSPLYQKAIFEHSDRKWCCPKTLEVSLDNLAVIKQIAAALNDYITIKEGK
jgi:hypothetical protein